MADRRDLILKVVRGERPLKDLKAAGVSLRFRALDRAQMSREVIVKPHDDPSLLVAPTAVDLAKGLLFYQARPVELREWGSFVLAADLIDLEPLESDPQGDLVLNGVWDAGFEGRLTDEIVQAARCLAGQSSE